MLPLISKKNRKILTEIVLVGMTVIFLSSCESRFIPFAKPKATKSVVEGSGNINVTSNPSYASVYLDGSYEGYTPITIYGVEVGEHQVKVTYTGYSNYITTCTVWNGQTAYVTANLGGTAPTGLTATAGNGQVTLTWNSVSNAYYYKIYRSNSATGTYSYIGTAYSTSYTNTGLTNGQTYYYKVSAVDYSYNESALSSYVSATPTAGISTPTGLTATAGNGQVTLTWNSVSNAYYYKIYRSNSATGTYSYIGTAYSTSYTNTGLTNGQTYYYKVSAVDYSYNESALSSYVSATPTAGISTPTGLTATAGNGQVTLTWNSVSNAYYYKIYRSNSATGTYSYIGTAYSTSYTNTGLTSGQTYYYKVSAVDYSYNESALSSYASATPW